MQIKTIKRTNPVVIGVTLLISYKAAISQLELVKAVSELHVARY